MFLERFREQSLSWIPCIFLLIFTTPDAVPSEKVPLGAWEELLRPVWFLGEQAQRRIPGFEIILNHIRLLSKLFVYIFGCVWIWGYAWILGCGGIFGHPKKQETARSAASCVTVLEDLRNCR